MLTCTCIYTHNYFRKLEGLSDMEHKEFSERLTENTRQFLLSKLRAKIVDSSIDSSTAVTMIQKYEY